MRLTVNWRFLLKFTVAVVLLTAAVHFVHRRQVGKQGGAYLRHADAARDAGNREREISYLRRYLMTRPNDLDTRERLARGMCAAVKTGRNPMEAYLFLDDVLRRDPGRDNLRRFMIDFAVDPRIGLYAEAREHLDTLLQKQPADGELEGLYALCLAREGKYRTGSGSRGAADWYAESIKHRPDLIESYTGLAVILRLHLNRPEEAHQVIADMLKANPTRFLAHVYVAGYWRALGKPHQAAETVAKPIAQAQQLPPGTPVDAAVAAAIAEAQKHGPQELDVILLSADVARTRGQALARKGKEEEARKAVAEARQWLTRGVELHPKAVSVYLATASLDADVRIADAIAAIRKGLDAVPNSSELALALLDYQIQNADAAGATETLESLKAGGLSPALVEFGQARILAVQEKWLDATFLLDHVRQEASGDPGLVRRANLLLARCYAQIGENDRRLEAFSRAVPTDPADPLWAPTITGVAESQAVLGRPDDALATYRRLKDYVPSAWVQVAQFEMIRILRLPVEKRDWKPVRDALAACEQAFKDLPAERVPTDLYLARIDLLNFENKADEARKEAETLLAKRPKEVAVWTAVVRQNLRDKNPKKAEATLDAAEKQLGDSPDLRLARARLWAEEKAPDLATKLASLANGDKFSRGRQRRLLRELAAVAAAAGIEDLAGRLWDQLAAVQKDDLGVHLIRLDRALRAGDTAAAERIFAEIRRVDGESGTSARLTQAILLIRKAQTQKTVDGLDTALQLLNGLARERPRWGRVALGQALVHDLRGEAEALAKYRDAVDYGETTPEALRRLTELLYSKGRFGEAEAILQKLDDTTAADPEAQRLAAEVHLRMDNPKGALVAAVKAVSPDSKNPRDHIWLGQVYWAVGEKAKAESLFRKAVEMRPSAVEGWLLLIRYLATTDRKDEAIKTLERAKEKVEKVERPLFVALACAQTGQMELAEAAFRQARLERPDDLRIAQAEAEFFFQSGKLPEARSAFQRVIEMKSATTEDKDFARRMLAIALAADRDYETSRKALEVVGLLGGTAGRPAGAETPAQRRGRALILSLQRDRASKLEALRLLEEDRNTLTPSDLFLVAQLHLTVGNRAQVRVTLADLLRKPGATKVPLYLIFSAAWLLKEGDIREADALVKQLEKLQPDTMQTAELKAKVSAARKDLPSARSVLLAKAEAAGAQIGVLARVCEEVGLYPEAEQLFKRFVEENKAARPQTVLALAAFYGRRGRTADALQVCDAARATVPAPVVGEVAVSALYAVPMPDPADATKVVGWLEAAAGKSQGKIRATLLQQLASLRNLQGEYAAAADLYRRALGEDEKDVLAMNNLAFLLSVREGKHDDALQVLDRAKKIIGPDPNLLDTEAIVRLKKGEVAAARKVLEEILAATPTASGYFHLAQVEHKAERKLEARIAWQRAEELELRKADLHPLEREAYDQLSRLLK